MYSGTTKSVQTRAFINEMVTVGRGSSKNDKILKH